MKQRIFIILIMVTFLIAGTPIPAHADGVVGNGTPSSCTRDALNSALMSANNITFNCGSAPVTISMTSVIDLVAVNKTIDGAGLITLQGTSGNRIFSQRTFGTTASTVTLNNLTLTGASVSSDGAAIWSVNQSADWPGHPPTLNLNNVTFSNNTATPSFSTSNPYDNGGGAIFTGAGILNIVGSTFNANRVVGGAGGAIHGLGSNISITNTFFTNNQAIPTGPTSDNSGYGGAIYVDGALPNSGGYIVISGSVFGSNSAGNQGGFAYINLYGSRNETLTIDRSSFYGNSVSGGRIGNGGALSGGGTNGAVGVGISNSTFASNSVASAQNNGSGGAIALFQDANTTISSSTFYNNQALGVCGNCYSDGGAIAIGNHTQPFTISNSTIAGNYAGWVGGGITGSNGILRNTIVANNHADNGGNTWQIQQQCSSQLSGTNNMQYPPRNPNSNFFNEVICSPNIPQVDPLLGSLANNGGSTQTIALIPGSPAILGGNCALVPAVTTDQRGIHRKTPCDLGAYETPATPFETVGLYSPLGGQFYLKTANAVGAQDYLLSFGPAPSALIPLVGDWTGQGIKTPGLYDPGSGYFYLKNSNTSGNADIIFQFGPTGQGLLPIVGDWIGQGHDSIGLYSPASAYFLLKNSLSVGNADNTFSFGPTNAGLMPLVGDWNGQGFATVGLYSPANAFFYLKYSNGPGNADLVFQYGPATGNGGPAGIPLTGRWVGQRSASIGIYVAANAYFYLKNIPGSGNADIQFQYGPGPNAGWKPIMGQWANPGPHISDGFSE